MHQLEAAPPAENLLRSPRPRGPVIRETQIVPRVAPSQTQQNMQLFGCTVLSGLYIISSGEHESIYRYTRDIEDLLVEGLEVGTPAKDAKVDPTKVSAGATASIRVVILVRRLCLDVRRRPAQKKIALITPRKPGHQRWSWSPSSRACCGFRPQRRHPSRQAA